jgi:hypothetical protein
MIRKPESDEVSHSRTKINRLVLDLASAVATRLADLHALDTAGSPGYPPAHGTLGAHKTPPLHRLSGVHNRDALYSARREPRTRAQT